MVQLFEFDGEKLKINLAEVLMYKEFDMLWNDKEYNGKNEDLEGGFHDKSYKLFKFMWLCYFPKSMLMQLETEEERLETALYDSGLKKADIEVAVAQLAIERYKKFIYDVRLFRMFRSGNTLIDKITLQNDTLNVNERDENNKLVHNAANLMKQVATLNEMAEGLLALEATVKSELAVGKKLRGEDTEEGFLD